MKGAKINWLWVGLIIIVVVLAYFFFLRGGQPDINDLNDNNNDVSVPETSVVSAGTYEVLITSKSFVPLRIEIKAGDTIVFTNNDTKVHRPASISAPVVGVYPGYNESKCGTSEEKDIFDSCRDLAQGESYSFKFEEKGNWGYWDVLTPSWTGFIKVA